MPKAIATPEKSFYVRFLGQFKAFQKPGVNYEKSINFILND
jgi:hypothetical protein